MYADRTHIWGLEFSFSRPVDGKASILLGQIPDEGLFNSEIYHMDLESGLGERITGLEAFYEDPTFIFGLKVSSSVHWTRSVQIRWWVFANNIQVLY